jgi:2-polyprenyl-3-methyl-5-hydroxy-6-metoxy-1,4-benzoquinol methylase
MVLREFIKQKYIKIGPLVKPGSEVLDIGCYKAAILPFLERVKYTGVDIDEEAIKDLKRRGIKAHKVDLNKNEIDFKEKFDNILILDLLEHLVDPKGLILKAKKFLKVEGKIIISLPNDYHFLNKIRFLMNKELYTSFKPTGHLHIFPIRNGKRLLESCGLEIVKEVHVAPHKPVVVPMYFKNILSKISPNNFSRVIIYVAKVRDN